MSNEFAKLLLDLESAKKKLDKEKGKRSVILVLTYTAISAAILYVANLSVEDIAVLSLVAGVGIFFISSICQVLVTSWFTNINPIEHQISSIEAKIREIDPHSEWLGK